MLRLFTIRDSMRLIPSVSSSVYVFPFFANENGKGSACMIELG